MNNPQLTKTHLEVTRNLTDEDRHWLLEQLGEEFAEFSSQDMAAFVHAGHGFDDLAHEPELYSFTDYELIVAI